MHIYVLIDSLESLKTVQRVITRWTLKTISSGKFAVILNSKDAKSWGRQPSRMADVSSYSAAKCCKYQNLLDAFVKNMLWHSADEQWMKCL